MFNLAMAQMRVVGGAKRENLTRAAHWIARAAAEGAQVVLLPEAMNLGWTHGSAHEAADEIPGGETCEALQAAACAQGVHVCAGLVERAGNRIFNAAVLIDPKGEIVIHHRKLNELELAHDMYAPGEQLSVARTALGMVGVMICADAFVPGQVVGRALGVMGAQVILSPCAWAVPAEHDNTRDPYGALWRENYGPVAREFRLWIAGCSNVGWITDGPWAGRKCIGNSLVVGPDGEPALIGSHGVEAEELLFIEVKPETRRREGRDMGAAASARPPVGGGAVS